MVTTINGDNGTYLNIDMWNDDEFIPNRYGADCFCNDLSGTCWGWIYDDAGKIIGDYESDDSVLVGDNFLVDFDIEASTKITAATDVCASSAGTPVNKIIYRKPDDVCYGYANSGKKIEMAFWDWTCMEIILQNYIDSGLSRDEAINQFWADVKAYDPEEFDLILESSGCDDFNDCVSNGEYDELRVDYFMSLGFTEEPSEKDPNVDIQACDDVNATTNLSSSTKYMANMVSASTSNSSLVFENYGDVNFLDDGCVAAADPDREGCYYVITCYPVADVNSDHHYLIQDCYVDINDSWIDPDEVGDYSGVHGFKTKEEEAWFAVDCVHYYGGQNFGAYVPSSGLANYDDVLYTAEGVEEYMSKYNLPSSIYFDGE